jgi:NADP-dependent 3-hydroxy acid dehydrogenase YdfG
MTFTGASQGIGRSTAIRVARDCSSVVLAARNANALKEVADTVKNTGAKPLVCGLDLSKIESAETLIKATIDRFDRIDDLLNIAGAVPCPRKLDPGSLLDCTQCWYSQLRQAVRVRGVGSYG